MSRHRPPAMWGFSLVELMIALILGVVITLAATQLFTVNQRSFQLQQAMSQLQEDGQLSTRFIANDLLLTGFYEDGVSSPVLPGVLFAPASLNGRAFPASSDGGAGGNDRLTISYHGGVDCEGALSPGGGNEPLINTYWVENEQLRCRGSNSAGGGVTLLNGVERFQVLYGLRDAAADRPRVRQYVSSAGVGADQVMAVKFAVLLRSDNVRLPESDEAQTLILLDGTVVVQPDTAMRRVFQRTITFRNFDWDIDA